MTKRLVTCAVVLLAMPLLAAAQQPAPGAFANTNDKLSYAIGADIASSFKRQQLEINVDLLIKGFRDAYSGGQVALTEQEIRETIVGFQQEMRAKAQERKKAEVEQNVKEENAFLAENAKKEGVVTLPSGLQYKIITMGTGKKPAESDIVTVNYRGTLLNGKEFDSSYGRKQPATFGVNRVIKGWTEALQLMPTGSKWQLFIPAKLAYGEAGHAPAIGPSACLVFEVELLGIGEPAPPPAPKPQP